MHHPTDSIAHTTAFVTPVVKRQWDILFLLLYFVFNISDADIKKHTNKQNKITETLAFRINLLPSAVLATTNTILNLTLTLNIILKLTITMTMEYIHTYMHAYMER